MTVTCTFVAMAAVVAVIIAAVGMTTTMAMPMPAPAIRNGTTTVRCCRVVATATHSRSGYSKFGRLLGRCRGLAHATRPQRAELGWLCRFAAERLPVCMRACVEVAVPVATIAAVAVTAAMAAMRVTVVGVRIALLATGGMAMRMAVPTGSMRMPVAVRVAVAAVGVAVPTMGVTVGRVIDPWHLSHHATVKRQGLHGIGSVSTVRDTLQKRMLLNLQASPVRFVVPCHEDTARNTDLYRDICATTPTKQCARLLAHTLLVYVVLHLHVHRGYNDITSQLPHVRLPHTDYTIQRSDLQTARWWAMTHNTPHDLWCGVLPE